MLLRLPLSSVDSLIIPPKNYKELGLLLDYVVSYPKDFSSPQGFTILTKNKEEMIKLLKEGKVNLVALELSSVRENPAADKLEYAVAGGELNIKAWGHRGLTEASKFNHQGWENPEHNPDTMKRDFTISNQEVSSGSI